MKKFFDIIVLCVIVIFIFPSCSKNQEFDLEIETDKQKWWDEAKFGMFIHFGVYSVPAGRFVGTDLDGVTYTSNESSTANGVGAEWLMFTSRIPRETYKLYANSFTCSNFNADEIAMLAKSAGMKYLVITIKHHDGFVMYPTKFTEWNIANSAAKGKDIINEIQNACVRNGLKFGVYFSQNIDWMAEGSYGEVPEINGYYDDHSKYDLYTKNLINEFVNRYPNIDLIWWDGYHANSNEVVANLFKNAALSVRPNIIFNDRLYSKHEGDYITPEMNLNLPIQKFQRFELCNSINKKSWGYSESVHQQYYMSAKEIIVNLLRCIQYGGNMLLNVGPKADGSIPHSQTTPLREAGEIIHKMGGVYKSNSLKQLYGQHNCICRYTEENGQTILYVTKMPGVDVPEISVTGINNSISSVKTNHTVTKVGNTITIKGLKGDFDTARIQLVGEIDCYDAGINLPCVGVISPLSAYANGELGVGLGDEDQFMYTNWRGNYSGSIEYMFNVIEEKSYKISVYTAEMSNYEITIEIDGVKYPKNISLGYQRHKSTIIDAISLSKGSHVIKLTISSDEEKWANFYGIEFE